MANLSWECGVSGQPAGFALYCSSVTASSQFTCSPPFTSCMAMCSMLCSGVAPCQCFSFGGIQTVSPARTWRIGPPQVCTWPTPDVMCSVCPSGWVCQNVRAPGSKRTQPARNSAGSGAWMIGSCHTVPVKLDAGPRRDGRDPQTMMSIVSTSPGAFVFSERHFYTSGAHAKSPASPPGFGVSEVLLSCWRASSRLQVAGCLLAALGDNLVADPLALVERAHAGALDGGDVHEYILGAVFRLNKAEAFLGIEELHSSDRHHSSFQASC